MSQKEDEQKAALRLKTGLGNDYRELLTNRGWERLKKFLVGKYMMAFYNLKDMKKTDQDIMADKAWMNVVELIFREIDNKIDFGKRAEEDLLKILNKKR